MLDYLKKISENYNIKQIITCTDNSTYQKEYPVYRGINMINSDQIRKVCDAPIFSVLNTLEIPIRMCEHTVDDVTGYELDLEKVDDGFDGQCYSDEFCSQGFAIATKMLLESIKLHRGYSSERQKTKSRNNQ